MCLTVFVSSAQLMKVCAWRASASGSCGLGEQVEEEAGAYFDGGGDGGNGVDGA
jgi:hypothetical protein